MGSTEEWGNQDEGEGKLAASPARTRKSASISTGATKLPRVPSNRAMSKVLSSPAASRDGAAAESVRVSTVAQGAPPHTLTVQGPAVLQHCLREAQANAELSRKSVHQPPPASPKGISQLPPVLPLVPAAAHPSSGHVTPSPASPTAPDKAGAPSAESTQQARSSRWATIGKGGHLYPRVQQAAANNVERRSSLPLLQVQKHEQRQLQQKMWAQMDADRAWGQWGKVNQQKNGQGSMHSPVQRPLHKSPRSPRISLQQLEDLMEELLQKQAELEGNILADPDDPSPADTKALVEVKKRLVKVGGMCQQERERQRLQQIDNRHQDEHQQGQHAAWERRGLEQHLQPRRHRSASCLQVPEENERALKKTSSSPFGGMSPSDGTVHPVQDPSLPASPFSRPSWPSYSAAATAYATLAAQLSSQLSQPPAGSSSTAAQMGAWPWTRSSVPLPAVPGQGPLQHGMGAHSAQPSGGASLPCSLLSASPSVLSSSSDAVPPGGCNPSAGVRVFRGLVLPQPVCQASGVRESSTDLANLFRGQQRFNRL